MKPTLPEMIAKSEALLEELFPEPVSKDREMLLKLMNAFDTEHSICEVCGHQEETKDTDSAHMLREYLQSTTVEDT